MPKPGSMAALRESGIGTTQESRCCIDSSAFEGLTEKCAGNFESTSLTQGGTPASAATPSALSPRRPCRQLSLATSKRALEQHAIGKRVSRGRCEPVYKSCRETEGSRAQTLKPSNGGQAFGREHASIALREPDRRLFGSPSRATEEELYGQRARPSEACARRARRRVSDRKCRREVDGECGWPAPRPSPRRRS